MLLKLLPFICSGMAANFPFPFPEGFGPAEMLNCGGFCNNDQYLVCGRSWVYPYIRTFPNHCYMEVANQCLQSQTYDPRPVYREVADSLCNYHKHYEYFEVLTCEETKTLATRQKQFYNNEVNNIVNPTDQFDDIKNTLINFKTSEIFNKQLVQVLLNQLKEIFLQTNCKACTEETVHQYTKCINDEVEKFKMALEEFYDDFEKLKKIRNLNSIEFANDFTKLTETLLNKFLSVRGIKEYYSKKLESFYEMYLQILNNYVVGTTGKTLNDETNKPLPKCDIVNDLNRLTIESVQITSSSNAYFQPSKEEYVTMYGGVIEDKGGVELIKSYESFFARSLTASLRAYVSPRDVLVFVSDFLGNGSTCVQSDKILIHINNRVTVAQQNPCDVTYLDSTSQEQILKSYSRYLNEFDESEKTWRELYRMLYSFKNSKYRSFLETKYDDDFADIEKKFQVKMKILNKTKSIKNVVEIQKRKFYKHHEFMSNLYYNVHEPGWIETYNRNKCNRCYGLGLSFCLQREANNLKTLLVQRNINIQNISGQLNELNKIKRWDFLNNARKASKDAFKTLKRSLTIKQVKDYYRKVLLSLYKEVITARENEYNYYRTENLLKSSKTIFQILQFVLNNLKRPYKAVDSCDYVLAIEEILHATNKVLTPYKKFPFWDLNDFAAKYIRSVTNVRDVDVLIDIFEDVFRVGNIETKNKLSDKLPDFEIFIRNEMYVLYYMVNEGYCKGISVIKEAGKAVWDVFDCFAQVLKKRSNEPMEDFHEYLTNLTGSEEYNRCYVKTL